MSITYCVFVVPSVKDPKGGRRGEQLISWLKRVSQPVKVDFLDSNTLEKMQGILSNNVALVEDARKLALRKLLVLLDDEVSRCKFMNLCFGGFY